MKGRNPRSGLLLVSVLLPMSIGACNRASPDPSAEAPPPAKVVAAADASVFAVEHPEQFPLAEASARPSRPELAVTGTVTPDISRTVPVVSLVSGRVVAIRARLGDTVTAGQVLLSVRSDDIAAAFSDYRKAVSAEILARTQLARSQDLYGHGAISLNDLQVAQDAGTRAKVDLETSAEHLLNLGGDLNRPTGIVDIAAPVSGVITDQQVTNAAGVQSLGTNPFTISDLSSVWIVCDVYENDLPNVRLGDSADVRLNAYPAKVLKGTISNIGTVLDPTIRTAKVRIEIQNPGVLRLGMFVTATLHGRTLETHTVVPASAVLHIHDRDWVYLPTQDRKFRRVEVSSGDALPDNMQEIKSGLRPGQRVVSNALVLEHTIDQ